MRQVPDFMLLLKELSMAARASNKTFSVAIPPYPAYLDIGWMSLVPYIDMYNFQVRLHGLKVV